MGFFADLQHAIQKSFTPEPEVVVVSQVHNTKEWMGPHIPSIHDHLKAHLFKFEKSQGEEVKMFYKEWSGDTFWLPQSGIPLLMAHESRLCPIGTPQLLTPHYDQDSLKKLEVTLDRVAAYLEKGGAKEWWEEWLKRAKEDESVEQSCQPGKGLNSICYYMYDVFTMHYDFDIIESWILQCVNSDGVCSNVQMDDRSSHISGVDIESPYKAALKEKEQDVEIPGIGLVCTRWVGEKGKRQLIQLADQETCRTLQQELQTLANECKKALTVLGADTSPDPQVQKANSLCDEYLHKSSRKCKSSLHNQRMEVLWKSQHDEFPGTVAGPAGATAVLGSQLVDTITEKHKQPPDVSFNITHVLHAYAECSMPVLFRNRR